MRFDNLEAYISVDSVQLAEYDIKANAAKKELMCWIPSEVGKSFAVNWKALTRPTFDMSSTTSIDGTCVGGAMLSTEDKDWLCTTSMLQTSRTKGRPFIFSSLELTDDDDFLHFGHSNALGDIVIEIWHVTDTGNPPCEYETPMIHEGKVHERSKQALAHRVKFGKEQPAPPENIVEVNTVCLLVTFTFKYRSIDILRASGIAPPNRTMLVTNKKRGKFPSRERITDVRRFK